MQLRFSEVSVLRGPMRLNLWTTCLVIALTTRIGAVQAQQSRDLTRPVAASLIVKDPRFATTSVLSLVSPEESVKAGVTEGLWVEESFGSIVLADVGRRYFTQASGLPNYSVVLAQPARRQVVDVTGIVNIPGERNLKEVAFRWRYVGLPQVVARYTGQGQAPHQSKAVLRLHDEGWRVEQLMLGESARVRFAAPSATILRKEASDTERFLTRLKQSTRPSQQLGTFTWPDHKVTITDVGFKFEEPATTSCYWFGQVENIQVARRLDGSKNTPVREIIAFRRDSIRPTTIGALEAAPGDIAPLEKAITSAHRAWVAKYAEVVARLKSVSQTPNFVDLAKQGRQSWYDEEAKAVACDEALTPQTAAQMPEGLTIGSKWTGSIDNIGAAELQITSVSTAIITYNGVRETVELQVGNDGEIVLRGVAYEIFSGPNRIFKLDTFRGRFSADRQSIAGTWKDAGTGSGRWSVSRAKQ